MGWTATCKRVELDPYLTLYTKRNSLLFLQGKSLNLSSPYLSEYPYSHTLARVSFVKVQIWPSNPQFILTDDAPVILLRAQGKHPSSWQ